MARVRYRELHCKSVMNRVHGMPFKWSINPYRGCVHGCHYCYARGTHTYLDLDVDEDFSGIVFAKVNAPDVLRAELRRPSWRRESVSIGSATDPYQPAEGRFQLTNRILRVLHEYHNPVSIVTKGTLILRDRDLLAAMATGAGCTVCFSVPTVDTAIWRATEPGTAPPLQRLNVMARLAAAGSTSACWRRRLFQALRGRPSSLRRRCAPLPSTAPGSYGPTSSILANSSATITCASWTMNTRVSCPCIPVCTRKIPASAGRERVGEARSGTQGGVWVGRSTPASTPAGTAQACLRALSEPCRSHLAWNHFNAPVIDVFAGIA